jgi:predicted ester cyclase
VKRVLCFGPGICACAISFLYHGLKISKHNFCFTPGPVSIFLLKKQIMESSKLQVLRQIVEKGFGNADLHVIDKLIKDDWIEHQVNLKGGKEVLNKAILSLERAFSNRKYTLANYSVNGDIVWVHYKFSGKHTGSFMGYEPTGKEIVIDVMDIARIENDQLVEHWGIPDRFALLIQLGFFPAPTGKTLFAKTNLTGTQAS